MNSTGVGYICFGCFSLINQTLFYAAALSNGLVDYSLVNPELQLMRFGTTRIKVEHLVIS